MGFPSPYDNNVSQTDSIGSLVQFPSILGTVVTFPDGREYIRTGSARAVSSAYSEASRHPLLRVIGKLGNSSTITGTPFDIATNGSGTFVVTTSDTTNYFYSTDYGATWTATPHGFASFPPLSVAYDATVGGWAFVGHNTTNVEIRTTTAPGVATTQRVATASSTSATEGIVLKSTGGRFIASNGSLAWYSTALATWTAATTAPSMGAIALRMVVGSGRVILHNSSSSVYYSNDGGVNWVGGIGLPASCTMGLYNPADSTYYYFQSGGGLFKSSTGYSGYVASSFPENGMSTNRPTAALRAGGQTYDGRMYYTVANGTIGFTSDMVEVSNIQTQVVSAGSSIICIDSSGNFVQVVTGTTSVCYGQLNTCNYVGVLLPVRGDGATINSPVYYARVR